MRKHHLQWGIAIALLAGCLFSYQSTAPTLRQLVSFWFSDFSEDKSYNTLFLGSSSIARLPIYLLKPCALVKIRGFHNSDLSTLHNYMSVVATQENLNHVMLYAGENDIVAGYSVEETLESYRHLLHSIQRKLSPKHVVIMAIKLSPSRKEYWPQFSRFNNALKAIADTSINTEIVTSALSYGVDEGWYLDDGVHLTAQGYRVMIEPILDVCKRGV